MRLLLLTKCGSTWGLWRLMTSIIDSWGSAHENSLQKSQNNVFMWNVELLCAEWRESQTELRLLFFFILSGADAGTHKV